MAKPTPPILKCGHTTLHLTSCPHCKSLQQKYYTKIAKDGFKDIESGLEHPQFLYQPTDLEAIDPITTSYYDSIWDVYHSWVKEGRSERDCLVAELLAKQEGRTGTVRGISAVLKGKKLKPYSWVKVQKTITEIKDLVRSNQKTSATSPP